MLLVLYVHGCLVISVVLFQQEISTDLHHFTSVSVLEQCYLPVQIQVLQVTLMGLFKDNDFLPL